MFFSDASDWPLLAGYVCRIPRLACPELWLHCVSVREFFDKFPEVRNPDHPPWSGFSHFGPFAPPPRAQRLTASMESSRHSTHPQSVVEECSTPCGINGILTISAPPR